MSLNPINVSGRTQSRSPLSINHSFRWSEGLEPPVLYCGWRNVMSRENWQALLFGLILLALCFVQ